MWKSTTTWTLFRRGWNRGRVPNAQCCGPESRRRIGSSLEPNCSCSRSPRTADYASRTCSGNHCAGTPLFRVAMALVEGPAGSHLIRERTKKRTIPKAVEELSERNSILSPWRGSSLRYHGPRSQLSLSRLSCDREPQRVFSRSCNALWLKTGKAQLSRSFFHATWERSCASPSTHGRGSEGSSVHTQFSSTKLSRCLYDKCRASPITRTSAHWPRRRC